MAKEKHWQEVQRSKEELEMMRMEHEQKMAIDREEHDLRMTILRQSVGAYRGSQILQNRKICSYLINSS